MPYGVKMSYMIVLLGRLLEKTSKFAQRFKNKYIIDCFARHGTEVRIEGRCCLSAANIYCGSNVYIGPGACFVSSDAKIVIGNNVMFGPNVMIATGNHRFDVIGKVMADVREKTAKDDADVTIEDDVWIGMGAIILKGVTIGKGSVIAAGAIVTKNVAPYSIVYSQSKLIVKKRFSEEEIEKHETLLRQGENDEN